MESIVIIISIVISIVVLVILLNRFSCISENANFTIGSPVPNYPISYIQGVRIGRKILDPNYHDPAIYGPSRRHLGPS